MRFQVPNSKFKIIILPHINAKILDKDISSRKKSVEYIKTNTSSNKYRLNDCDTREICRVAMFVDSGTHPTRDIGSERNSLFEI